MSPDELRAQIREHRKALAAAEEERARVQKFVEQFRGRDCRTLYYREDPSYDVCQDMAKLPGMLKEAESRVTRERTQIEALQEDARRRGYRSTVYDPD